MAGDGARLLIGRIGAAHGIKGEVRLHSFAHNPADIGAYGPLATDRPGLTLVIEVVRPAGGPMLIARLRGVADRTAAEKLNGVGLFLDRAALPATEDGDYYHADLIGLKARRTDGTVIGMVVGVPNFGAGDILEVRDELTGDTFLYPFTRATVPEVNVAGGYVVIEPPVETEPGTEEPD